MNYCERIPVKTRKVTLSGTAEKIECEGLEVTVFAESGDVYIKANAETPDSESYILKTGTSITLCGAFVLNASTSSARLLYCKVI